MNTLAIDIGGSGLKATVLDADANLLVERVRIETPVGAPPADYIRLLTELVRPLPTFDRVAVGFPGMVRFGIVHTAPNLDNDEWRGFALAEALAKALQKPVRVANDADVQGFAAIRGQGLEMVITLGTGFGTALYLDGRLCPHLEISHQPFRHGKTYDEMLGEAARDEIGNKKWRKRVAKAIANMHALTHYDRLFVGGGNARHLKELPDNVHTVDNIAGLIGGIRLWQDA